MAWNIIGQLAGGAGSGATWTTGHGAPVTPGVNPGDMYLDVDTGNVYRWNGASWSLAGNIEGPAGPTGPPGSTGPAGATGSTGADGAIGRPNIGPVGPRGNDGNKWLIGANAPQPSDGVVGDLFFQTTQLTTGPILLKGDPGPQGIEGPVGPPGKMPNMMTRINITSNQSVANNTVTAVQWANIDVDNQGAFNPANNTRLTAPASGWYMVGGTSHWPTTGNESTTRVMDFRVNGSTTIGITSGVPGEATINDMRLNGNFFTFLNKGDYVEMLVYQHDGGTISLTAPIYFWLILVGN